MTAPGSPPTAAAEELLGHARRLLATDDHALGATAMRASALLGRSAAEQAIWSLFPQLQQVSGRAMLLVFTARFGDVGRRATLAWNRLSAASHHHLHELPPTVEELTPLLDDVHDVVQAIRALQEARAAGVTRATGR